MTPTADLWAIGYDDVGAQPSRSARRSPTSAGHRRGRQGFDPLGHCPRRSASRRFVHVRPTTAAGVGANVTGSSVVDYLAGLVLARPG